MIKNLTYVVILSTVLGFSIFGRNGFLELLNYEKQLEALQSRLGELRAETSTESNTLYGINNNPGYLEKLGREKLGLSKEDEVLYIFDNKGELDSKECAADKDCNK